MLIGPSSPKVLCTNSAVLVSAKSVISSKEVTPSPNNFSPNSLAELNRLASTVPKSTALPF